MAVAWSCMMWYCLSVAICTETHRLQVLGTELHVLRERLSSVVRGLRSNRAPCSSCCSTPKNRRLAREQSWQKNSMFASGLVLSFESVVDHASHAVARRFVLAEDCLGLGQQSLNLLRLGIKFLRDREHLTGKAIAGLPKLLDPASCRAFGSSWSYFSANSSARMIPASAKSTSSGQRSGMLLGPADDDRSASGIASASRMCSIGLSSSSSGSLPRTKAR